MPERTALELFRELSDFVNGAEGSAESAEVIGLRAAIRSALDTVKNALRLYGSQKLVCSFNGGKVRSRKIVLQSVVAVLSLGAPVLQDATVLLHLVRCAYADFFQVEDPGGMVSTSPLLPTTYPALPVLTGSLWSGLEGRVKCVYWKEDNEFEEVQHFVDDLVLEYKLDMHVFSSGFKVCRARIQRTAASVSCPMNTMGCARSQRGLQESIDNTGAQAFLLGTRRGDPNGETASEFEPSSLSWPAFMRVNPLLQWNYRHVWMFLRRYHLPYCLLYDRVCCSLPHAPCSQCARVPSSGIGSTNHEEHVAATQGYTSLGNKSNTRPNPALLVPQTGLYRPAHELVDGQLERCGRQAANGVVDPTGAPALPHDFRTVPQVRALDERRGLRARPGRSRELG